MRQLRNWGSTGRPLHESEHLSRVAASHTRHSGRAGCDCEHERRHRLLGVYFVMHLSRLPTFHRLRGCDDTVVVITGAIVTAAFLLSGKTGRFWNVPFAKPWIAIFALTIIAAGFGGYPRLSVPFILEVGARFHVLPFFCCAFLITPRRVRQLLSASPAVPCCCCCCACSTVSSQRAGWPSVDATRESERTCIRDDFRDAGLLLLAYARSGFARTVWLVSFPVSILYLLKTGSRGSFVTLVVLIAAMFWLLRGRSRTIMLMLAPVLGVAMLTTVPAETWTRLTLIVTDPLQTEAQVDDIQLRGALGSQAARMELQKRAVELSFRYPLFGVGR